MAETIVWNTGALNRLLNGPDGPVARDVGRRAVRVQSAARVRCPVDTGLLRSSIGIILGKDAAGVYADIGSNVNYAYWVHEGTSRMLPRPFLRDALPAAL